VKNQHIVNQALASYLPSSDDPKYDDYVESLPHYRENLESRFPQVCADCAPRVEERLRRSGYTAKTDHLRRMVQRTRTLPRSQMKATSKITYLLFNLGGLVWWTAFTLEILLHVAALGYMRLTGTTQDSGLAFSSTHWQRFENQIFAIRSRQDQLLVLEFCLSIVSLWWNPALRDTIRAPGLRLKGQGWYSLLQALFILERTMGWLRLRGSISGAPSQRGQEGLHVLMLIFATVTLLISRQVVRVDYSSHGFFSENNTPVLRRSTSSLQPAPILQDTRDSLSKPSAFQMKTSFPVNRLGNTPSKQQPRQQNTVFDGLDDGDLTEEDEMDWAPSAASFSPVPKRTVLTQSSIPEPSPFLSNLPAAPRSINARLRNPNQPPAFVKPSPETQKSFFQRSGLGREESMNSVDRESSKMAPQKLFMPSENQETGLESMFTTSFSLKEDPAEILNAKNSRNNGQLSRAPAGLALLNAFICGFAAGLWAYSPYWSESILIQLLIASTATAVLSISYSKRFTSTIDVSHLVGLATVLSLLLSFSCCFDILADKPEPDSQIVLVRYMSGSIVYSFMLLHQIWIYIASLNQTRRPVVQQRNSRKQLSGDTTSIKRVATTNAKLNDSPPQSLINGHTNSSDDNSSSDDDTGSPLLPSRRRNMAKQTPFGSSSGTDRGSTSAGTYARTPQRQQTSALATYNNVPSSKLKSLTLSDSPASLGGSPGVYAQQNGSRFSQPYRKQQQQQQSSLFGGSSRTGGGDGDFWGL
jgi:hypothetical protein